VVAQGWAENIAMVNLPARAFVMALIIDDGVRSRGHRRNIFNPNYNAAGTAYNPYARYGSCLQNRFCQPLHRGRVRTGRKRAAYSF
jgi:uncharacterized protein YkwD